jgi:hypothetical protein
MLYDAITTLESDGEARVMLLLPNSIFSESDNGGIAVTMPTLY